MGKISSKTNVITTLLAIVNILAGIFIMIIILLMQGIFAFLLGLIYILIGICILVKKSYFWFLLCGVIPVTLLFSLNIIMMGVSKDVPSYYQTPLFIGIPLITFFWIICILDVVYLRQKKEKKKGDVPQGERLR